MSSYPYKSDHRGAPVPSITRVPHGRTPSHFRIIGNFGVSENLTPPKTILFPPACGERGTTDNVRDLT
jgi:hypothetical protein